MEMKEYFFDTYAVIELLRESHSYAPYLNEQIRITLLNLIEISYITLLEQGEEAAKRVLGWCKEFVVDVPDVVIMAAVTFRAQNKKKSLSYADCLGYAFARQHDLIFLTGD